MARIDERLPAPPAPPIVRPGMDAMGDAFMAAAAEGSTLHSVFEMFHTAGLKQSFYPEQGYIAADDPQLEPYKRWISRFEDSGSRKETAFRVRKLRRASERQDRMAQNSIGSFFGLLFGMGTSPENFLIPGGLANTGLKGMAVGAAAGAAGELPYYLAREDVDPVVSALSVAAVAGMTGLSGAFIGRVNGSRRARHGLPEEMPEEVLSQADIQRRRAFKESAEEALAGTGAEPNLRPEVYAARNGVGADVTPGAEIFVDTFDDVTLAGAGGLEKKIKFNPVMRLLNSASVAARQIVRDMVEDGGLLFNEYSRGTTSARSPVERNFRTNWMGGDENAPGVLYSIQLQEEAYARYSGVEVGKTPTATAFNVLRRDIGDTITRKGGDRLSRRGFREEVGKAMRRGDRHEIPEVAETARNWRKLSDRLKEAAAEQDLFTAELRHRRSRILAKADGLDAKGVARGLDQYDQDVLQAIDSQIDLIRQSGAPRVTTAESYFMRVIKLDKVEKERARFTDEVVKPYLQRRGLPREAIDGEANKFVDDLLATPDHPHLDADDLSPSNSVRERDWDIPDEMLEEWLENDVEQVMRYQTRSLGADIELSRSFGGYEMHGVIEDIRADWTQRIRGAESPEEAAKLIKGMEADLRDIRALRDRLRGTYGQPSDPYRVLSRFYRVTKSLATLAYMGGVTLSSLPDMVRPIMVEGFSRSFRGALEPLFTETGRAARRMAAQEVRLAGEAGDIMNSLTASQLADIGDIAGRRFPMERVLGNLTDKLFLINGLNSWNTMLKEWSGLIVSSRMLEATRQWADGTIDAAQRTKLLRSGINEEMAGRIAAMFEKEGQIEGAVWLPNTASWSDREAVAAFRGALSNDVNRIIVTPGVGDKALWTSTEWGSVMAQFKTYGQSAMQRILISGLQERDAAFFQGAAMLIAMGHVTNQMKQAQYGYDPQQGFMGDLVDAVDRSGVLGFFMDINNSMERITDYTVGARPLLGEAPGSSTGVSKMGAILGPGSTLYANMGASLMHLVKGDGNALDAKKLRSTAIYNSVPWLDPIFDGIEEGVFRPLMERNGGRALFDDQPTGNTQPWRR